MNEAIFRHSVHKETVQEEMVNQEKLPFRFCLSHILFQTVHLILRDNTNADQDSFLVFVELHIIAIFNDQVSIACPIKWK